MTLRSWLSHSETPYDQNIKIREKDKQHLIINT